MVRKDRLLRGVSVACVTPMDAAGARVRYEAIEPYVEFLCTRGVHGLFVAGTTGEGCLLSIEERTRTAEAFVRAGQGRVVVVPQCGSLVFEETRALIEHAAKIGADGAAVVTPFFFSYSQESLYDYYSDILQIEPHLPIYAYNIPQLTNNAISTETMRRLAERFPNFCGVKDSSKSAEVVLDDVDQLPEGFAVIVGSDELFLALLQSGILGCVSGPATVVPEMFVRVYTEFKRAEISKAHGSQKSLSALSRMLGGGGNLDMLKKALGWRGIDVGSVRRPLPRVPRETEQELRRQFEALWEDVGFSV